MKVNWVGEAVFELPAGSVMSLVSTSIVTDSSASVGMNVKTVFMYI